MGRNGSLSYQVNQSIRGQIAYGHSKYQDKINGTTGDKIYSFSTAKNYTKNACRAMNEIKAAHPDVRTLEDARVHVGEYLQGKIDAGLAASSIHSYAHALGKVYGCSAKAFGVDLPQRNRSDFQRSRGDKVRDAHFSATKNAELVDFCRATGLRREDLETLKGDALLEKDGKYFLDVQNSKGGRDRISPIIGTEEQIKAVADRCKAAGDGVVWGKVHNAADIHGYRSDYARDLYAQNERDIGSLPRSERYDCRNDRAGEHYDKKALQIVSEALGHGKSDKPRYDVVISNYFR
jgi:hypothetical protein